jgi:D-proline reductase (dithiol) PrdB
MPNAARVAEELAPKLAERVNRYECQAVLLVPASRLCVQTLGIVARAIEQTGVPTMLIAPERQVADKIRPPRTAFYKGEFGCVVGKPNWKEYQLRVLDEAIRWIETLDQPVVKKLAVELETEVENERGER